MKTRANHLFKAFFMLTLVSTLMVSCGQKNSSGGGTTTAPGIGVGGYGGYAGANGNHLQIIETENPCIINGQPSNQPRVSHIIPSTGNQTVNIGGIYVGVTPEGDVAIISNQNGVATIDLRICPRPDLTGAPAAVVSPVITNVAPYCQVSEITSGDVQVPAQYGPYLLRFAPIHIPNANRFSSLCQ